MKVLLRIATVLAVAGALIWDTAWMVGVVR